VAAPTFFEVQQEAERISRALPEMSRKAESMREYQERADKLKADLIDIAGQIIQTSDRLIAEIRALPPEKAAEHVALLEQFERGRKLAFERMGQYNPEQLWFWTEEWQMESLLPRVPLRAVSNRSWSPIALRAALAHSPGSRRPG